jgi:hypothetical protein
MNTVQTALHYFTTSVAVVPWLFVVRCQLAHGRLRLASLFPSFATRRVTASPFLRCPMLHPLSSSLSISSSHTAFQSPAASLFAAIFRCLSAARSIHGTRHNVFEEQAFLSISSRAIRSTSTHHPALSDHQMDASPIHPQTPNHALQRTAPGCHIRCLLPPPSPPAAFPQRLRQPSAVAELGVASKIRRFIYDSQHPRPASSPQNTRLWTDF